MKKLLICFSSIGAAMLMSGIIVMAYCNSKGAVMDIPYNANINFDNAETEVSDETTIPQQDEDYNYAEGLAQEFENITVSTNAAHVYIQPGSKLTVNGTDLSDGKLSCTEHDNTLEINYNTNINLLSDFISDTEIIITVPEKIYKNISYTAAAGDVELSDISSESLKMKLSAGDFTLENCNADNMNFTVSAGSLNAENCVSRDFSLIQSAGDTQLDNFTINGNANVKISAGSLEMNLDGSSDDFSYDVTKSAGSIEIDGESDIPSNSSAQKQFVIKVSAGDCEINFD